MTAVHEAAPDPDSPQPAAVTGSAGADRCRAVLRCGHRRGIAGVPRRPGCQQDRRQSPVRAGRQPVQGSDRVRMGRRALGPVGVFLPNNPGAACPRPTCSGMRFAGWNGPDTSRCGTTRESVARTGWYSLACCWPPPSGWHLARPSPISGPGRRRPRTARRSCWPTPIPAVSCSGWESATRSRPSRSGGTTAARWPPSAITSSR